jgi:ankyrin repeat protein
VKLFLDARTEVNLQNKNGTTPLNFAVDHGTDHMVRMLLDAGADMNAEDERCESGKVNRIALEMLHLWARPTR